MSRGSRATVGDTRWSPNGYHYTKISTGWELTHRIIAERMLGRPLAENERVRFKDNDRRNLDESNIMVTITREASKARRIATIEAKIDELKAELAHLQETEDA